MNPYEVLEISPGASAEEVKTAYHRMAKQWHPDRFAGEAKAEAEARFRTVTEAFNMLKDAPRRPEPEAPPAQAPQAPRGPAPPIQLEAPQEKAPQNRTVEEWFQEAKAAAEAKAYDRAIGMVQYAIRLDGERGELHALYGKLLDLTGGDKRMLVRTLETAIRLDPKDVDSSILLAQTFQSLGMHARASRLWTTVHNLAPNHPIFAPPPRKGGQGLGDQLSALLANFRESLNRIMKRG